jgi:hypothetical protein
MMGKQLQTGVNHFWAVSTTDEDEDQNHRLPDDKNEAAAGDIEQGMGSTTDQFKLLHSSLNHSFGLFEHQDRKSQAAASLPVFKHLGN